MKPFSKTTNKWILSTAMVAALGSQYYFSVSSNHLEKFELSSTASEEELAKKIKAEKDGKPAPEIVKAAPPAEKPAPKQLELVPKPKDQSAQPTQPSAAPEKKPDMKIEGTNYQVYCEACSGENKWVVLSDINLKNATEIASALSLKKEGSSKTQVATEEPKKPVETTQERRERENEEREEKKRLAKEAKEEKKQAKENKLRAEKEERNDAFTEKAEEIADRCQDDLNCRVDRFTSLMRSYSGSKKVDQSVVSKAYNTLIDKDLKAGLRGSAGSEGKIAALEALETLMGGDLPSEYKALKTRAIDATKSAQMAQANAITGLYKQADVYKSQHNVTAETQTRGSALQADQAFRRESELIYNSMYEGASSAKDQTTLDYVINTYAPDMRNILARLSNPTGLSYSDVTTTSIGNRGGRTGNTTGVNINNGGAVINNSNNNLGGVNFGTPSTNRTGTRTGVNPK